MKKDKQASGKSISKKLSSAFLMLLAGTVLTAGIGIFSLLKIILQKDVSDIRAIGLPLVAALAVLLLFEVVVAVLLRRRIMKSVDEPLKEIERATKLFSVGYLDTHVNYRSDDEIGRVAVMLNGTFEQLKMMIQEISDILAGMAEGDYTHPGIRNYQNDFQLVSDAFNRILDRQNKTFRIFVESAAQLDASAQQVSNGAQQLAQGATEQASTTEELTSSVAEISRQIGENSKRTAEAAQYLTETARQVEESDGQMKKLLAAMDDINQASDEIGKIIKAIDDIAFQTNILALNAAVEASRAGEAGKGFAVVADEVRSLAGKTAEESKRTADLIESTIAKIHDGRALATSTSKGLDGVSEKVGQLDDTVQKIAKASQSESVAVTQVDQGMEQISSVVQSNSATSEESAAASQELAGQADVLKKELDRFRLRQANA